MLNVGSNTVSQLFVGVASDKNGMGIKTAVIGDEIIYTRPGGYFFLELDEKENE